MKVTLDTNFLISATQWDSSVCAKVLYKLINQNAKIYSTTDILSEFSEVLSRDFNRSNEYIKDLTSTLIKFIKIVEPIEIIDIVKNDPDDNKILECAIASSSDYILTYDNHLLKFKEFRGIKIIKPEELLSQI